MNETIFNIDTLSSFIDIANNINNYHTTHELSMDDIIKWTYAN